MEFTKDWFINISIGQPTVRNQGKGIAKGVRYAISKEFKFDKFFTALLDKDPKEYSRFLDKMTRKVASQYGLDADDSCTDAPIYWGVARKCINILARNIVYNRYVWKQERQNWRKFDSEFHISKLELPLDSYTIEGLRDDCRNKEIQLGNSLNKQFRIKHLEKIDSTAIQNIATIIAEKRKTCRVNLDILYWRQRLEFENE